MKLLTPSTLLLLLVFISFITFMGFTHPTPGSPSSSSSFFSSSSSSSSSTPLSALSSSPSSSARTASDPLPPRLLPCTDMREEGDKRQRLFFFTVIAAFEYPALIKAFLGHYLAMGIPPDCFHITLHSLNSSGPFRGEILQLLESLQLKKVEIWEDEWSDPKKLIRGQQALETMGVGKGDWILHVDSDEFQEYPLPLYDLLEEMETHHLDCAAGDFADRVSKTGALLSLEKEFSTKLFPFACHIVKKVMKANPHKLGPYRYGLMPTSGGYHTLNNYSPENQGAMVFVGIRVHHFKWVHGVLDELLERDGDRVMTPLQVFLKEHGMKVCVDCPELECVRVEHLQALVPPSSVYHQGIQGRYVWKIDHLRKKEEEEEARKAQEKVALN